MRYGPRRRTRGPQVGMPAWETLIVACWRLGIGDCGLAPAELTRQAHRRGRGDLQQDFLSVLVDHTEQLTMCGVIHGQGELAVRSVDLGTINFLHSLEEMVLRYQ